MKEVNFMNTFTAIGRLTADPKANKTKNDVAISSFVLAIPKGNDEADFIRCIAWDKTASVINKNCKKGSKIGITGSMHTRSYKDDNDQTVYVVECLVTGMDFFDTKEGSGSKKEKKAEASDMPFDFPE